MAALKKYKEVILNVERSDYTKIISIMDGNDIDSFLIVNPTDNCQLASFGNFESILGSIDYYEKNFLSRLMKDIKNLSYKRLFLIDITYNAYKTYKKEINEVFDLVNIKRYTNTNESSMVLCLCRFNE